MCPPHPSTGKFTFLPNITLYLKTCDRQRTKVYCRPPIIRLIMYPSLFLWDCSVTGSGKNRGRLNSREASQEHEEGRTGLGHNAAAAPGRRRGNLEGESSLWMLGSLLSAWKLPQPRFSALGPPHPPGSGDRRDWYFSQASWSHHAAEPGPEPQRGTSHLPLTPSGTLRAARAPTVRRATAT